MKHKHLTGLSLAAVWGALVLLVSGGTVVGETKSDSGLATADAISGGQCEDGDLTCLAGLMAGSDDGSSDDVKSRDGKSDDKGSKDDDSKSDDSSSDDGKSGDDKSDDKGSKDDDSKSDDDSSSDDVEPIVPNLSIGDGQGEEFNELTQVPVSLRVVLDAPTSSTVTVNWATENGSALAGMDYLPASGQLNFDPNMTEATITVFIIGDDEGEFEESFFVRLSLPSGAATIDNLGEIVILDDDDIDD